jgi:large subunit ribosomal protein L16
MNFQKSKYRKVHKPRKSKVVFEQKRVLPGYGTYALKVLLSTRITFSQLDAAKRTLKKVVKKNAFLWQNVFADQPVTSKPAEVRMGKGKGSFSHNVALVSCGTILFEIGGPNLTDKLAKQAIDQAAVKLGIPSKFIRYILNKKN